MQKIPKKNKSEILVKKTTGTNQDEKPEIKKEIKTFITINIFSDKRIYTKEKLIKYEWYVKGKQLACWQVLIKSDQSHLSICDESKDAHINWHHKCSIDWLCVIFSINLW